MLSGHEAYFLPIYKIFLSWRKLLKKFAFYGTVNFAAVLFFTWAGKTLALLTCRKSISSGYEALQVIRRFLFLSFFTGF
jgi:hypothetical protein